MDKLPNLLKSRKFWASVTALAFAVFGERAGVDGAELNSAIGVLIAYILGTALEDGLSRRA
jgi:hypothetical protein